jgi:hypothetical protein
VRGERRSGTCLHCQLSLVVGCKQLTLEDKEKGNLCGHYRDRCEGNGRGGHAKVGADRVKGQDERCFASEMSEENDFGALPDLLLGNMLVLFISLNSVSRG